MSFSFDFNHGALLDATDVRSADISDRINAHIDAAFFAKRKAEAPRNYVGASAIGNECLRAVQLGYMKLTPDAGRITGKALRIFEVGHIFEDAIGKWLQMAGFQLEIIDPTTNKQWGFSMLDGEAEGHLDGIVREGPIPMGYPCLWECKALNEKSWQDVKKRGLHISKPLYARQIAINAAMMELHEHPALFTAINKNTSELHHELIPFDQQLAQDMSDRMLRVVEATKQQELLPRAFADPDFYKCKFCDYRKTCWEKLK